MVLDVGFFMVLWKAVGMVCLKVGRTELYLEKLLGLQKGINFEYMMGVNLDI